MRRFVTAGAGCVLIAFAACPSEAPPPPKAPENPAPIASVQEVPPAPAPPTIRELASTEDWHALAAAIDALPEIERNASKMRFLRARAAIEDGDPKTALASLDAVNLPPLADEIDRLRAKAKLEIGPFDEAAAYFEKRADAASLFSAAQARLSAGENAKARDLATRAIDTTHDRLLEARARALRIRSSVDADEKADALWLLTHAADLPESADAALAKKQPALTSEERIARIHALADAGKVDDALAEAAKIPAGIEEKRARADALYRGRRYADAANVLAECAATSGAHAEEDAFLAARALSRADRDEEAARAWGEIVKKGGGLADESSFMIARLDFLHARWTDAAKGFDEYLRAHPYGLERKDALRGRAIAKLLAGDATVAKTMLADLARAEPDARARARLENLQAIAAYNAGDAKSAIEIWTRIAQNPPLTWPALVARARLAAVKAPLPIAIEPAKSESANIASLDLPADVAILHDLGLDSDAERRLARREPRADRAVLCNAYGSLDRARRRFTLSLGAPGLDLAPGANTKWAWDCAFPAPFANVVARAEETEKLPAHLVYSVMRTESGFDADVVSPARAVGLMQLLPETAEAVAKEMNRTYDRAWLVRGPYNIELGAHYLASLLEKFHGSVPLAVAAYNCGPEAVEKWTARATGLDVDMFVETIPYLETRGYVVQVMGNFARYTVLAKGEAPSIDLSIPR